MHFTLYTEKTVSQCMRDLNERLQAKPTKTRPELQGWVEKQGTFAITITAPVIGKLKRTTSLKGKANRERGVTIIEGYVSDGISPFWSRVLLGVLAVIGLLLIVVGQPFIALIMAFAAAVIFIPLRGDYFNSDRLLIEVEKTLKASPKPPKK